MTTQELESFLKENEYIEFFDDVEKEQLCFRNTRLAWYQNNPNSVTAITYAKMDELTPESLIFAINKSLEVENITRITGYFTKVSSWNPGKRGELKDRKKFTV